MNLKFGIIQKPRAFFDVETGCKDPDTNKLEDHTKRFDEEENTTMGGFSEMLNRLLGDQKNTPEGKGKYDTAIQKAGEISKNNDSPEDKKKGLKSIYDEVKGDGKTTEQSEFNNTLKSAGDKYTQNQVAVGLNKAEGIAKETACPANGGRNPPGNPAENPVFRI